MKSQSLNDKLKFINKYLFFLIYIIGFISVLMVTIGSITEIYGLFECSGNALFVIIILIIIRQILKVIINYNGNTNPNNISDKDNIVLSEQPKNPDDK